MNSTLVAKNQFGEQSNFSVLGGSLGLACTFAVAPADAGGKGITGLVTQGVPGISAVYMHTSATAATGNPNPAAGYIVVEFAKAFAGFSGFRASLNAPLSGSSVNVTSGLTQYGIYVITAVGTSTAANWQTLGLPANVTPAVGQVFVAATASAGSGTGTVQAVAAAGSGLGDIEVVGTPGAGLVSNSGGGQIVLACYAATSSSVTTKAVTAPAVGTLISLKFDLTAVAGPLI